MPRDTPQSPVDTELRINNATLQIDNLDIKITGIAPGLVNTNQQVVTQKKSDGTEGIDILDISAGTQTSDIKVTLDGEVVSVKDDNANTAGTSKGIYVDSSSTTVLALNANRKKAIIVNDSDETIYLKYGSGAELNKGIRLNEEGGAIEETVYTGIITAISTSGTKTVTVTEM